MNNIIYISDTESDELSDELNECLKETMELKPFFDPLVPLGSVICLCFYEGTTTVDTWDSMTLSRGYETEIQIFDCMGNLQGRLPDNLSATLAPLMDYHRISLTAVVSGRPLSIKLPLKIQISTTQVNKQKILNYLEKNKVFGDRPEPLKENKWESLLEKLDVEETKDLNVGMKEVDLSKLPLAQPPLGMDTELLSYQKQGLAWMIMMENPKPPTESEESQFWIIRQNKLYNTILNMSFPLGVRLSRGGLLADDMGLGKTIQVLSLICCNQNQKFVNLMEQSTDYCNSTLIICPLSVVGNWTQQIDTHFKKLRLKYYCFHGPQRNGSIHFLKSQDIVISTYHILSQNPEANPLHKIKWRRVVLDEGHVIRTKKTKMSKSACLLQAERKWLLTGTPIHNRLNDMYPYFKFIQFQPFDNYELWNRTIIKQKDKDPKAMKAFRDVMALICLRRTKKMKVNGKPLLDLPEINYYVQKVKMNPSEDQIYRRVEAKTKKALDRMMQKERIKLADMNMILAIICRLRQICDHWMLAKKKNKYSRDALCMLLHENINQNCLSCDNEMQDPVITVCAHWFCKSCIMENCCLCLEPIEQFYDTAELEVPENQVLECEFESSSKIDALMSFLESARLSSTKSVVFSQWTSMLNLIEIPLKKRNFNYVRLDGTMQRLKRESTIERFKNEDIGVFLISLHCGSTGLNLSCASNCFLVDPWWNPQIESQAIDRVYRIGQKKNVTVVRFAVENTIEERVLQLQETKKQLASDMFNEKSFTNQVVSSRLKDIQSLLGNIITVSDTE